MKKKFSKFIFFHKIFFLARVDEERVSNEFETHSPSARKTISAHYEEAELNKCASVP